MVGFVDVEPAAAHLNGGEAAYTVMDTFFENDNVIEIKVTAKFIDVMNITTYYVDRETNRKKGINVSFVYEEKSQL